MSNKTIIITRPSGQAQQLSEMLQANLRTSGIAKVALPHMISLPLLTIVPKSDHALANQIATSLHTADLAIFVSPNAIECTMRLLEKSWQVLSDKPILIGVMGGSSLHALKNHGMTMADAPSKIIVPSDTAHWDSEGLWHELQKLQWNWADKKVVIFKGEGGREWLADTLIGAGAQLEAISVYTRIPLDLESPIWHDIREIDYAQSLWLLTSSEAVRHLGQVKLPIASASALCSHRNIADAARQIGFGEVLICEAGDDALMLATQTWLLAQ